MNNVSLAHKAKFCLEGNKYGKAIFAVKYCHTSEDKREM